MQLISMAGTWKQEEFLKKDIRYPVLMNISTSYWDVYSVHILKEVIWTIVDSWAPRAVGLTQKQENDNISC